MTEEWRKVEQDVSPLEYEVSNLGRVRSRKKGAWYILTPMRASPNDTVDYPFVRIGRRKRYVHRLVAQAFLPPPERPTDVVRHRDGNTLNPAAANLLWGTRRDNAVDALRHGGRSLLDAEKVAAIRGMHRRHSMSAEKLAEVFNVSRQAISAAIKYKTWSHLP